MTAGRLGSANYASSSSPLPSSCSVRCAQCAICGNEEIITLRMTYPEHMHTFAKTRVPHPAHDPVRLSDSAPETTSKGWLALLHACSATSTACGFQRPLSVQVAVTAGAVSPQDGGYRDADGGAVHTRHNQHGGCIWLPDIQPRWIVLSGDSPNAHTTVRSRAAISAPVLLTVASLAASSGPTCAQTPSMLSDFPADWRDQSQVLQCIWKGIYGLVPLPASLR
jgi:hypothetical protein